MPSPKMKRAGSKRARIAKRQRNVAKNEKLRELGIHPKQLRHDKQMRVHMSRIRVSAFEQGRCKCPGAGGGVRKVTKAERMGTSIASLMNTIARMYGVDDD